jgi:tetratricopeptide (TPR) repeat protein
MSMLSTESIKKVGRLIATGQLDEAERICRNALADGAPDAISYINLGHIAYQKRSFDEAIGFLEAALAIDPDSSPALYNLGVISDQSGDLDAAESYYRRAIAADPQNIAPCKNLASLLLDAGRLDAAGRPTPRSSKEHRSMWMHISPIRG